MKSLVVFYSIAGHTYNVAKNISELLNSDLKEVQRGETYKSSLGYLSVGYHSWQGYLPSTEADKYDPAHYDLVVFASPIWGGRLAYPIRNYLNAYKGHFKRTAFLLTNGCYNPSIDSDDISNLCGGIPSETQLITTDEIDDGSYKSIIESFAGKLFLCDGACLSCKRKNFEAHDTLSYM